MSIFTFHYRYIFIFLLLSLFAHFHSQAQEIKITPNEVSQLIKTAKNKVIDYEEWLNTIGSVKNTKWYGSDIESVIKLDFESEKAPVLHNLKSNKNESIEIKEYLDYIKPNFSTGITFTHKVLSYKEPCTINTPSHTFLYVKLICLQSIEVGKQPYKSDTLDFYVKFIVRQLKPLKTDLDKIYKITQHKETSCVDEQLQENIEPTDKTLTRAKISEGNETKVLKDYAKTLVIDYANVLNGLNNEKIMLDNLVKEYYYNDSSKIHNDIIRTSDKVSSFSPKAYIDAIRTYWKKNGIKFRYDVQEDNITTTPSLGFMNVDVLVKRRIITKNYKNKNNRFEGKIKVSVYFPVDNAGDVILERGSAKIHRIEESIVSEDAKIEKANTYYLQVGAQLNTVNYFGELNRIEKTTGTTLQFTRNSFGFHVIKKIKRKVYLKANYTWGILRGDDFVAADARDERHKFRYIRNLHFRNYFHEFSLIANYELFKPKGSRFRVRPYNQRTSFNIYFFGGIGVFRHNPKAKTPLNIGGNWVSLRDIGTEGQGRPGYKKKYSLWQVSVPLGIGAKIKITPRIDLGVEFSGRLTFTDYLDDVSGDYPAMEDLDILARLMSNRTLESNSAITGKSRVEEITRLLTELDGNLVYVGTDGNTYKTFNGYGRKGDQRGSSKTNDFFIVSGIHLNYIFGRSK